MKRNALLLLLVIFCFVFSCKRVRDGDIDPDATAQLAKCPLRSINSSSGEQIYGFEYTLGRIKRIVSYDGIEMASTFTYNAKDKIEKMVITTDNNTDDYTVLFEYDAAGKVAKTRTSIKDFEFMTNQFTYSGNNIQTISTTFNIFGNTVKGKTRIEYLDANVSKVYTQIDGYPELLAFEGVSYDTKPQFMPEGYRIMALGFVGIANNFFASFGQNNPTLVKIYDDNGKLTETTQTVYEYDKSGIVTKADQTLTDADNKKTARGIVFKFVCL
ncbi:hypothetical protein [Emticicia sp. 17c]|uniref:hypothetical protein n=1 Tax=Emticicia sp. 17c TaxID=3127704 RepID=UPI00301D5D30